MTYSFCLFLCSAACPLVFKNPSSVVEVCSGSSPSNATCCMSLYSYISNLQKQMLITNVQALDCVTLFGSMLIKKGINTNLYKLCQVDLKDFSLQGVWKRCVSLGFSHYPAYLLFYKGWLINFFIFVSCPFCMCLSLGSSPWGTR